jgi:hypothetical protein
VFAVSILTCIAALAIPAGPAAASPAGAGAAIRAVLVRFAMAAYADDSKEMCALATPAAGQIFVSAAGFLATPP